MLSPELQLLAPPHTWVASLQGASEQSLAAGNLGQPTRRRRRPAPGGGRPSRGTACGCGASRRRGSRWPGRGTGAPTSASGGTGRTPAKHWMKDYNVKLYADP